MTKRARSISSRIAGQTLVIALIVLGVLLAIGLVFLGIVARNVNITSYNRQRSAAYDLSQAGIRFAFHELVYSPSGADYRPIPTVLAPVAGNPDSTRDPDALYLRPAATDPGTGSPYGLRSDTDPQVDKGGPDGLGPYTRIEFQNGRALVRVRYAPSDANIFSSEPTGALRTPGRARDYTIIECVGRPGKVTFNDPTSANAGNVVQFQNFAASTDFRNALALMKKYDGQIVLSSKQLAFASIGIIESTEFITNPFKLSRAADLGIPYLLGAVIQTTALQNVDVASGKDINTNAQVTTPLSMIRGIEAPLYNLGNPPTPTAGPIGFGGGIFSNADIRINGLLDLRLAAPLGDMLASAGLIYGADSASTLRVELNSIDPVTNQWLPTVVTDLQNGTNPSLNSRGTFSTLKGTLKDGIATTDVDGFSRGIGTKTPPSEFSEDPDTQLSRPIESTRESGSLIANTNSGVYGYGQGPYINNFSDRQNPADEQGRAQVGTSESLPYDWLNPNNGHANSGWQGAFYVPRGAYMRLVNDGFYIFRDSRAPAKERYWSGPDGNEPHDTTGADVQSGSIRYRIGLGSDNLPHIINTYTPDPLDTTKALDINTTSNFDAGPVFDGVVYFEGNVRVRGIIPTDIQMTVVSNATIYIEGSVTKGVTTGLGQRINRPSRSMCMFIAHDYVTLNTTQFFGPDPSQALEAVNDTSNSIAYNPIRMRVGGAGLSFVNEEILDPNSASADPLDPTTWRPFALDYREYFDATNDTGAPLVQKLFLAHTMDDGPAPATYISLDVNYATQRSGGTDWSYQFQLSANNAASQPYFDNNGALTSNDYEPIYGLGVEPWQRYSRFETIGFPLVRNDYSYDTTGNWEFFGTGAPNDPEGIYDLFPDAENVYTFSHNNVGTDPTNDYLVARASAVPGDVRIEASMFAENGSFFVIPGPPFNPNPNDRRDVFNATVVNNGGFNSATAIQQAQQERLDNFGASADTPFYGEPLDVHITISGAISEAMPAPIDQQAQWIKRWGWIPAQLGCAYDFTTIPPRPILIPRSHVASGYYPANPPGGQPVALFVPNLVVGYDPILATGRTNGFDTSSTNLDIREDAYGRSLPPLPRLPVSPTLSYFGEVNP